MTTSAPAACRIAAGNIDPLILGEIERRRLELTSRDARRENYEEHHQGEVALHHAIQQATGNTNLVHLLETLSDRIAGVRMVNVPGRLRTSAVEHLEIMSALREGDPDAAEAMRQHLANAKKDLFRSLPTDLPHIPTALG